MSYELDAEDIREEVRSRALLGMEHRADVIRVTESADPDSDLVTVEMASGKAWHVRIQVEVTEA